MAVIVGEAMATSNTEATAVTNNLAISNTATVVTNNLVTSNTATEVTNNLDKVG